METNETPAQRRVRMMTIIEKVFGQFAFKVMTTGRKLYTVDCMIAVEDACRATMFTEEQVRLAINYARTIRDTTYTEIINQIKTPNPMTPEEILHESIKTELQFLKTIESEEELNYKNEHGQYIFSNGNTIINIPYLLSEYKLWLLEQKLHVKKSF